MSMDNKEQLKLVIDNVIKGDTEAMKAAFAPYIEAKSREILGYGNSEPVVPAMTQDVMEGLLSQLKEALEMSDSEVRLSGDKVVVGGKDVGVIQSDLTDFESGINFIENGGKFSKECVTVEELFKFLIDRYSKVSK